MDLEIRPATVHDLPQVLALCGLLDGGDERTLPMAAATARFVDLTSRQGHVVYVAELHGEIVGTFALIFVGGLAHTGRDSAIVEDVAVAADRQGSGIGRQMMAFAMRQSALRDCYKLTLSSHLRREAAHHFYDGLGFRKHGYSFLIDAVAAQENLT